MRETSIQAQRDNGRKRRQGPSHQVSSPTNNLGGPLFAREIFWSNPWQNKALSSTRLVRVRLVTAYLLNPTRALAAQPPLRLSIRTHRGMLTNPCLTGSAHSRLATMVATPVHHFSTRMEQPAPAVNPFSTASARSRSAIDQNHSKRQLRQKTPTPRGTHARGTLLTPH